MPRIPNEEFDRLKEEVSVQRLVEASGIGLKKSGKDLLGRCPFYEPEAPPACTCTATGIRHRVWGLIPSA